MRLMGLAALLLVGCVDVPTPQLADAPAAGDGAAPPATDAGDPPDRGPDGALADQGPAADAAQPVDQAVDAADAATLDAAPLPPADLELTYNGRVLNGGVFLFPDAPLFAEAPAPDTEWIQVRNNSDGPLTIEAAITGGLEPLFRIVSMPAQLGARQSARLGVTHTPAIGLSEATLTVSSPAGPFDVTLRAVGYRPVFAVVGNDQGRAISFDGGVTWQPTAGEPNSGGFSDVVCGGRCTGGDRDNPGPVALDGRCVAVGRSAPMNPPVSPLLSLTANGFLWSDVDVGAASSGLSRIDWGGAWYALDGLGRLLRSEDAIDWVAVDQVPANTLDLAVQDEAIVTVGPFGQRHFRAPGGRFQGEAPADPEGATLSVVVAHQGAFYAAGGDGRRIRRTPAGEWVDDVLDPTLGSLTALAATGADGGRVYVGGERAFQIAADGGWREVDADARGGPIRLAVSDDTLMALHLDGERGIDTRALDGVGWIDLGEGPFADMRAVAAGRLCASLAGGAGD